VLLPSVRGRRQQISVMRTITQTVAVLRYSSASAITVERSTTAAHSDASWQHCSPTTGACLATMAPSLPGGHHHTASSAAVRRLWQQRCPHRTAAHPLALPSRQRCVHCCATRSVAAALALHQGQRQSQRRLGAAPATTWRCQGAHTLQNRERIGAQAPPRARACMVCSHCCCWLLRRARRPLLTAASGPAAAHCRCVLTASRAQERTVVLLGDLLPFTQQRRRRGG
jgi:hypothetical protein